MDKNQVYDVLNEAYFGADSHEKDALAELPVLLKGADLFFDVGASLGQYSLAAAKLLRGGTVVGVEADAIRFEELERNYTKWAKEIGVSMKAHHAAAASEAGTVTFHTSSSNVSGGLSPDVKGETAESLDWKAEEVDALTLDDLAREFGRDPDLVKMDIEGGEAYALPGCREMLARGRVVFWIELHSHVRVEGKGSDQIVLELMSEHGYDGLPFHGKTLFAKNLSKRFRGLVWKRKLRGLFRFFSGKTTPESGI